MALGVQSLNEFYHNKLAAFSKPLPLFGVPYLLAFRWNICTKVCIIIISLFSYGGFEYLACNTVLFLIQ